MPPALGFQGIYFGRLRRPGVAPTASWPQGPLGAALRQEPLGQIPAPAGRFASLR